MNDEHAIRAALKGIDPEEIPLPAGLEEQLWAQLASEIYIVDGAPLLTSVDSTRKDEPHDITGPLESEDRTFAIRRAFRMAAAIALFAIVGVTVAQLMNPSSSTELASSQDQRDDSRSDSDTPVTDDEALDVGFELFPLISEVTRNSLVADFTTNEDSVYNATLVEDGRVVATTGGSTSAGEIAEFVFEDLASSTRYEVEVVLIGPPSIRSGRIPARTAGDTNLEITDLQLAGDFDRNEISFSTNLCATTSFVVLAAQDRSEVARVEPDPDAECSTTHTLTPDLSVQGSDAAEFLVIIETVSLDTGASVSSATASVTLISVQEN